MNSYEERQEARRERYLERAERARTESREGWQRAKEMTVLCCASVKGFGSRRFARFKGYLRWRLQAV